MGDTVAHASRAPEEETPPANNTGKERGKHRGKNRRKGSGSSSGSGGGGGGSKNSAHHPPPPAPPPPDSGTAVDKPSKQNGDVLLPAEKTQSSPDAAPLSQIKMEGDDTKREKEEGGGSSSGDGGGGGGGGGGGSNDPPAVDNTLTAENSSTTKPAPENDKSVEEEDLSISSLKDGSSENISSIEIDTSLGHDLSLGVGGGGGGSSNNNTTTTTNTHPGDDTSPDTETGLEISSMQDSMNNSDSLNELQTSSVLDDMTDGDNTNPTSERASIESGFVEGSSTMSDHKTTPTALEDPQSEEHSDKETKGGEGGGTGASVPCGNKSLLSSSTSSDSGIFSASKATMEEEVQFLREEVRTKAASVQRLQTSLYDQQVRANAAMVTLRTQLRHKDRAMLQARGQQEHRMSALLSHLLYLEGQMRQEQRQVLELLHEKDDVIRRQKSAIEDLASKNARLLAALKEVHGYSGGNGITPTSAGGTGGAEGESGSRPVVTTPVVLRNKDKGQKVRFGSVKDKLRRHKSSLELHRPTSLDTLVESRHHRYGSQENLTHGGNGQRGVSPDIRRKGSEGLCSDELKKNRQAERKERCKSLIDYPFHLNDLPEVSSEAEKGREESSPLPDSYPHQDLLSRSPHSSSSQLGTPHNRNSFYSDEEDAFHSGASQDGAKVYGELAKSTSMPQSLASPTDQDMSPASLKERPHSLSGVELSLNMEKMTMLPMERVSMNPSPTSQDAPGGSDSNPFKSIKNVFRRRNSKQRSKKRPASLGQQTNQEYHEALKEHFKKYDMS